MDDNGNLTFTPSPNAHGTALVSVRLEDNGGTAHGGVNETDPQTFLIDITKPHPFHNAVPGLAPDVSDGGGTGAPDGVVAAVDVLAIINYINAHGSGPLPAVRGRAYGPPYFDVVPDNYVAADDVITVINYINSHAGAGEGESPPVTQPARVKPSTMNDLLTLLAIDVASQPKRKL
jgi:hypothetical protein